MRWAPTRSPPAPLTDGSLEAVETMLGRTLPDAYVNLLREQNGGRLLRDVVLINDSIPAKFLGWIEDAYEIGTLHGAIPDKDALDSVTATSYMTTEWRLPPDLVLLAGNGHTWLALDYSKPGEPSVVIARADEPELFKIAENFTALLSQLVPYEAVWDADGVRIDKG